MIIGTKYKKIMTQFIIQNLNEEQIEFKEIEFIKKETADRMTVFDKENI